MPATSTTAFGIESIVVVRNGGFWTIQLPSSTTAAFELVQMPSFTMPAIELIQKPAFPTPTFGSVISRAFFPFSYSDCPSAVAIVPLLLRSSCPFSPSLLLLFFCFFSSSRLLLHFPLHLALLPPSPADASSSPDSVVFSSSARRFFAISGNASCPMLAGCS